MPCSWSKPKKSALPVDAKPKAKLTIKRKKDSVQDAPAAGDPGQDAPEAVDPDLAEAQAKGGKRKPK